MNSNLTSHTVRLPIVQKDVTITIPPAPTPTIQKLVTPTNTRPANPYYPIIKTLIDTNGEVGDVVVNSKTNVAYAADNQQFLLKIANGIPDFDHEQELSSGIKQLLLDEDNNRIYAMSSRQHIGETAEGVTILENEQIQGFIPFPGWVEGMVFEPSRHWVYVYGNPDYNKEPDLLSNDLGILMIIEGTRVIKTIKPWDVRVMQATADPVHGHIYFSSQYLANDLPEGPYSNLPHGRVSIYDGTQLITSIDKFPTLIYSFGINSNNNSIYAFTLGWKNTFPYGVTSFVNGQIKEQYHIQYASTVVDSVMHPRTGELYLLNFVDQRVELLIATSQNTPQFKKTISLNGTSVGFDEIIADPFSGNVYIRNARDSTITVIHDEEIIGTFKLTRGTDFMSLNPTNGDLYVSSSRAGDIWILGFEEGTIFP